MTTLTLPAFPDNRYVSKLSKRNRIKSIDLLRGIVMILMTLDHVRGYFHQDAFLFDPTDLAHTNTFLFFTRFITHYCAPVFVFLGGISAHLYGARRSKRELSYYLLTRGLWLVFAEPFIISLAWTFNPTYPIFNLQVIWAIGISMIVLSAMIYMNKRYILLTAIVFITAHNLLDDVHVPGTGIASLLWSILHQPGNFAVGQFTILVRYPVLPWIGILALGYCFGSVYDSSYDSRKRRKTLLSIGFAAIALFFILRAFNIYGDAAHWSTQKNAVLSLLSFFNVTKYPPSFLFTLLTLGPGMILLCLAEKPLNAFTSKMAVFGRVPFFYYIIHLFLIHLLAMIAAKMSGYNWSDMILSTRLNRTPALKGYGFNLSTVYMVWIGVVILLYPCCKGFDRYKSIHHHNKKWLTYL